MLVASLLRHHGFIHAVSDASFGNMSFARDQDGSARENRQRFLAAVGIPLEHCVSLSLAHGTTIREVTAADHGCGMTQNENLLPDADAFVTLDPNVFLFMLTADCIPVSIADPTTGAAALVHCGWRSVDQLLPKKVIQFLIHRGSKPAELMVHLGPGILPTSYIFSTAEIAQATDRHGPGWKPFILAIDDDHVAVDIPSYIQAQLIEMGVMPEHIEACGIDTASDPRYYSHYRSVRTNEPEARFATIFGRTLS